MTKGEFRSILDELINLYWDFNESVYLLDTMMEQLNANCLSLHSKVEMSATQREKIAKSVWILKRRMCKTRQKILTKINTIDVETLEALVASEI